MADRITTKEKIAQMLKEGATVRQIGAKLRCSHGLILEVRRDRQQPSMPVSFPEFRKWQAGKAVQHG